MGLQKGSNSSENRQVSAAARFAYLMTICGSGLVFLSLAFLLLGAEKISLSDVWSAVRAFDASNFNHLILRDIRLPRLIADIIVGSCLSVAGAVMQGQSRNPMADSGIMGISAGSAFAIVLMISFLPNATRLQRIGFSSMGALLATCLIYAIGFLGRRGGPERLVLAGMAISTLFGSISTAVMLKNGSSAQMFKYTAGSSANTIWQDIYVAAPFFLIGAVVSISLSRQLTLLNLSDEVSIGLGANTKFIRFIATMVVLIFSAIAVIVIGPVGYVGLMVPHIVRRFVGTDYRYVIPSSMVMGSFFVVIVDLLARVAIAPLEFPIGVLITVVGVPFFIYVSRHIRDREFRT